MARSIVKPESTFDFYEGLDSLGRTLPVDLDFSRLPFCECGEAYLRWVQDRFPDLLEDPTPQTLDKALLAITTEYGYRREYVEPHELNTCLREVFEELLDAVMSKREELQRHPSGGAFGAKLHLGDDVEPAGETKAAS